MPCTTALKGCEAQRWWVALWVDNAADQIYFGAEASPSLVYFDSEPS